MSKNEINRVKVKEFLPPIISDVYDYGTLQGELKSVKGVRFIEWDLGKLKPSENIVLSYRMRSKMGFIGEIQLDKGVVEVLDSEGNVKSTTHTNTILVDIKAKEKKEE